MVLVMQLSWCEFMQVAWQKGPQVQQLWRDTVALLAYPHVWIRKASGRLLGMLLSSNKSGEPLCHRCATTVPLRPHCDC